LRAIVQRASRAKVTVDNRIVGSIGRGLVIMLGVTEADTEADAEYLADKISELRVFSDADDKMNLALGDVGGAVLAISQFTLYGDCRRGRRPSYTAAARPQKAEELYEYFVRRILEKGVAVETGVFGAMMQVELVNDGPVTLMLDSSKLF
jgi:D-aminoacyl-tRNA deacylase